MVQQPDSFLIPYNTIEDGGFQKTSLLPNKSLDLQKAPSKSDMKIIEERVTLLLCSIDKLKPLCISKSLKSSVFQACKHDISACDI
jgi:hypothetical protein